MESEIKEEGIKQQSMDTTLTSQNVVEIKIPPPTTTTTTTTTTIQQQHQLDQQSSNTNSVKEESKSKKKRRKKSQMKKKNAQRKTSSSSSMGSTTPVDGTPPNADDSPNKAGEDADTSSLSISNNTNNSSNDEASPKSGEPTSAALITAMAGDDSLVSEQCKTSPITPSTTRMHDLDIHFFSDTEVTSSGGNGPCGIGRGAGRPSTPIQSDSELEISLREKETDSDLMTSSASWKWGELPTPELKADQTGDSQTTQAQRNSMLSNMFNFMKKNNKMRKQGAEGGVYLSDIDADPEMMAMYFPNVAGESMSKENSPAVGEAGTNNEDDRESGNGTSLPHSPSSLEGQKSLDSDYEDGKMPDGK